MQMSQERLQQQLNTAKAACKASELRQTEQQAQHDAHLSNLTTQLETAQQQVAELEAAHQQATSEHITTAESLAQQQQDNTQQRAAHAAFVHDQLAAVDKLHMEVATTAEEAESHMAAVAADVDALQQGYGHSQAEARQQLQQLKAAVVDWQQECSSVDQWQQEQGKAAGMLGMLSRLVKMQHQLADEGRPGLFALMDSHKQVQAQVCCHDIVLSGSALW